ncbi:MAG: hypothetical protein GC137_07490 [Alphaproteobacteria bacterium]|nr:hypothetical protein [Alphaproteobacteria bacterium]
MKMLMIVSCFVLITACGSSQGDRTLSGAGIGAGVGAAGSAVTGGNPLTGAIIGGGIGAATGALTEEKDIDLGEPAWK